jgi:UDPglucose--hexose-1-phosphate uridylyltransferase
MTIVRHDSRLADGRELFYFDDADTALPPERAIDTRALDPRPENARMRQDVLTGEWISIAAARQNRAFLPPAHLDPLAPRAATSSRRCSRIRRQKARSGSGEVSGIADGRAS